MRVLLADPTSQLSRTAGGDGYTVSDHIGFMVRDLLAGANWQRSGRKSGRPKPMSPLDKASPLHPDKVASRRDAAAAQAAKAAKAPDRADVIAYLEQFAPDGQRAATRGPTGE